jgi:serine phosphatase RsbU (regulator of sigma subunit)
VLFYTDGVTERMDRQGRMYDLLRLRTALSSRHAAAPALIAACRGPRALRRRPRAEDDLTLVAIGFD